MTVTEVKPAERGVSQQEKAIMRDHLRAIMDYFPNDLGYVCVVAIGLDGQFSRATRLSPDCLFGETLAPSLVAEILRRDVVTEMTNEIVNGKV